MGMRGPGAKTKKQRDEAKAKLRKRLPWNRKSLSRVARVVAFLEDLPITQGSLAGSKFKVRDWQRDFLEAVYREDAEGNRPVRTSVMTLARKNGKTQLAAALALCHLCGPEAEQRGEVVSVALTRDQAGKLFNEMKAIIEKHAELSDVCNVIRFTKQIEVLHGPGEGSTYQAMSADADSKLGLSPSFAIYDEAGSAPNRKLWDAIDTAMGARDDPLFMAISTQAADDHHFFSELVDYGVKIHEGEIEDDTFHLTAYTADLDDDPFDPVTWLKANPALGDFRSLPDVERQAAQARRVPSKENAFRNLICNQRVAAHTRFIAKAEWDACATPLEPLERRKAFGGLDLSSRRDLTCLALVFPDAAGGFDAEVEFWLPEVGIHDKAEADRVPWDVWAREGALSLIPGPVVDPAYIAEAIADAAARYQLECIAYDRWRIEDLRRELDRIGCHVALEPFGQGFKDMSPAVDKLEAVVADKRLRHGGNRILSMCAANAIVTQDAAGNRKLDKAKAAGRIDGLVALAMGLSAADRYEAETMPSCLAELMES